ncbi:hypothetical protein [Rhodococcus sp. NPDC058521]|uniref:hypothetical protein n=1 Tax=Rhodococcus sp. NPDC058521 TaxID=3346536 RepID=UPI00364D241A
MHPVAKRQRLELLVGLLGFFTVMALISAVGQIVQGTPSMMSSLVLLVCVVLTGLAITALMRVRRRS